MKFLKLGVFWGKNRNSHREYVLVTLFSFGINGCRGSNGILWYQEYAFVFWVCIGNLGILRYLLNYLWQLWYSLVSRVWIGIHGIHGNKRMPWYLWQPLNSVRFRRWRQHAIEGFGVKIVIWVVLSTHCRIVFTSNNSS